MSIVSGSGIKFTIKAVKYQRSIIELIFWTTTETYMEDFIISAIYGKIESGIAIEIDLLNKTGGVDPNKTFDVDIVFTVNTTQEIVDEMV